MEGKRELHLSGSLSAERSIPIVFGTIGTVEQVMVEEGQVVNQNQILARLVQRTFKDALGIAQAKADQAEDAYHRFLPMFRNKTLPEVKMVEVETGRAQAKLALSMASKNLEDTILRAPVSGIVANRYIEPGASALLGLPAFTLVQIETLMATAPIPEMKVGKITCGTRARVTVPALQKTIEGIVREIAVIANPLTRTYDIKVAVPNQTGELRIGMIADVYVQIDDGVCDSLVVPSEAVRIDETGVRYVFTIGRDSRLQKRQVEIVGFVAESMEIARGIEEGEQVVTSGTPMLAEGLFVRIVETRTQME